MLDVLHFYQKFGAFQGQKATIQARSSHLNPNPFELRVGLVPGIIPPDALLTAVAFMFLSLYIKRSFSPAPRHKLHD
jgi:hypothetical protein